MQIRGTARRRFPRAQNESHVVLWNVPRGQKNPAHRGSAAGVVCPNNCSNGRDHQRKKQSDQFITMLEKPANWIWNSFTVHDGSCLGHLGTFVKPQSAL